MDDASRDVPSRDADSRDADRGDAESRHADSRRGGEGVLCRFEVADAWHVGALLNLAPSFDVIYIDVGGISGTEVCMRVCVSV